MLSKPLVLISTFMLLVFTGADDKQADLKAKLEKKVKAKFVETGGWLLDYQEARRQAEKQDKPIFVYFTRTFAP
ncbi:MAG: hypothetical protein ACPG1Z_04520 [Planctomycetota bacterium]